VRVGTFMHEEGNGPVTKLNFILGPHFQPLLLLFLFLKSFDSVLQEFSFAFLRENVSPSAVRNQRQPGDLRAILHRPNEVGFQ
jgi:hypothetical protein